MWTLPMGYHATRSAPSWVMSIGYSPSGMDCSRVGSPQSHSSCQKTCCCGASTPLATGFSFLQGHLCLLQCGVLLALQVDMSSTVDLRGLQGTACVTMVRSMGCRGISAPGPGAPPALLHWPWCLQGCFSHIFLTPLTAAARWFLYFLKYAITEVPSVLLMRSALGSNKFVLEPAETGCQKWGKLLITSHRGHHCNSLLPKLCHVNPICMHTSNKNWYQVESNITLSHSIPCEGK